MKMMKYFLFAAATILTAGFAGSCSDDDSTATGETTIGFAEANYVFKESAGLVRIPLAVTGKSPVSFDVKVELEGGAALEEVAQFTQTQGLRYAGDEEVPVNIEFKTVDNDVIDASRFMTLTLTSVSGGKVSQATTRVEIADNDNNPYDRLMGDWTCTATDPNGAATTFDVNISGGFTPDEQTANAEKQLVCWGFGGQKVQQPGANPSHQLVWYMQYDGENKKLTVRAGAIMGNLWTFDGIDEDCEEKCGVYKFTGDPKISIDMAGSIVGTWNESMSQITFAENDGIVAVVFGIASGENYGYMVGCHSMTLKRK